MLLRFCFRLLIGHWHQVCSIFGLVSCNAILASARVVIVEALKTRRACVVGIVIECRYILAVRLIQGISMMSYFPTVNDMAVARK